MRSTDHTSNNAFQHNRQDKDKKIKALKKYISEQPYIPIQDQPKICEAFGLPPLRKVFRQEYKQRFYDYLYENIATVATVEFVTGIPQKYLTTCKTYYENKGLLQVVDSGQCPTTLSLNVQFLSTNPEDWIL